MKDLQSGQSKLGKMGMFIPLGLLLAFLALGHAQDHSEWETDGYFNGRFWGTMERGQKSGYIQGFGDGVNAMFNASPDSSAAKAKIRDMLLPSGMTYGETVKAIDAFYATPENGRIAIINAMVYVVAKAAGTSAQDLEKWTENQRASVAH
jgi:hypothetical protein